MLAKDREYLLSSDLRTWGNVTAGLPWLLFQSILLTSSHGLWRCFFLRLFNSDHLLSDVVLVLIFVRVGHSYQLALVPKPWNSKFHCISWSWNYLDGLRQAVGSVPLRRSGPLRFLRRRAVPPPPPHAPHPPAEAPRSRA